VRVKHSLHALQGRVDGAATLAPVAGVHRPKFVFTLLNRPYIRNILRGDRCEFQGDRCKVRTRERRERREVITRFIHCTRAYTRLESNNGVLALLVTTNLEALATADNLEALVGADGALQTQNDLLGSLGLFGEMTAM
jgi:hypothetical protein